MKSSRNKWINTAAGKVSIILIIIAVVMIIIVLTGWIHIGLSEREANSIDNILIGLATNLMGIIVTVSFVQFFIHKQDREEERKEERNKILRHDKMMTMLIRRYTLFFQCVSSTMNKRSIIARSTDLLRDFSFADMADMYKLSTVLSVELLRPSIELFYEAEQKLRDYMVDILKDVDFKYHKDIESIITTFIEKSITMDFSAVIINNQTIRAGNRAESEVAADYIREEKQHKWVNRYLQGELKANLMTPYVSLFFLLKEEGRLLTEYKHLINELKSTME